MNKSVNALKICYNFNECDPHLWYLKLSYRNLHLNR